MEVSTSWVDLPGEAGKMALFVAEPQEPGPHPGIVYFHPIMGINETTRQTAERIASEGFVVVVPNMYHRVGYRVEYVWPQDMQVSFKSAATLNFYGMAADSRVALNFLKERPNVAPDRVGVIGYCMGGTIAFLAACFHRDIAAAAVIYASHLDTTEVSPGRPVPPLHLAGNIQAPMLSISGNGDNNPAPADIKIIAATMEKLGKSFEHHIWEGDPPAGHAFFAEDLPERYNEAAAQWGWPIKLDFLKKHLQERPSWS